MKFAKIALIAAMGLAGISAAHAADQGHGTVTFTGSIIDAPCSISPDSIDQTVPLGQVSDSALANQGTSTPVPFQIKLEGCVLDENNSVSATFAGMADSTDDSMLGLSGTAQGAGIVIADQSGQQLDLGTASNAQTLLEGDNSLQFSAYLKGDAGSATVVPGDFQSVANFSLAYQ
ncbi:fimbrial protein [Klebsiella aerogenes]|uniref:fimbrial protein n=1 Tax=Klebsiella aerogenes TaxID=548 RepID=UPI000DA1DE25|nr:fimbrial protein [Klebsiella aerogenes]HCB2860385.1 type 1 fimbrial protein [Klebsiella aerogenes]HCB2865718.1 type 1 fimbrial protein [Klebsiella aerogenes]HCB2881617.1 type 1 fimbrial protein [Klebsiella aerogenes]HCB3346407.1 type 1 fimbrial protein [Klebsiella aerogenes]HCM1812453.1 type 1 fimbrial protein [Klebsiella aerogenes]